MKPIAKLHYNGYPGLDGQSVVNLTPSLSQTSSNHIVSTSQDQYDSYTSLAPAQRGSVYNMIEHPYVESYNDMSFNNLSTGTIVVIIISVIIFVIVLSIVLYIMHLKSVIHTLKFKIDALEYWNGINTSSERSTHKYTHYSDFT